jgi:acetyl-CoA acetyltransferase
MAAIAVKNHRDATTNPVTQFQHELTIEDALDAPTVAAPRSLFDCCPMTGFRN